MTFARIDTGGRWTAVRVLALMAGGLAVAAMIGGLLFAASGLYNVGASSGHWRVVAELLEFGLRRSVATHALLVDAPPPLDDPGMIRRGAGHYQGACASCHGAPGQERSVVVQQMLPPPPPLPDAMRDWTPEQLFWIVRHGIKYTGMPAWPAPEREDEVWAVAAFLLRMRGMDEAEYRRLALGRIDDAIDRSDEQARALVLTGPASGATAACARCHGTDGAGDAGSPRLAGQSVEYLLHALEEYAWGARPSGIMGPVAAAVDARQRRALAEHYAAAPAPAAPVQAPAGEDSGLGRRLATQGDADRLIPACGTCHGAGRLPAYPALAGQGAGYIADQLRLWQRGARGQGATSAIMAAVAAALTEDDIQAVARFYATQPPAGR